ncbi:hypothetical protein HU200_048757 [Digitaria exilis]|uniref:DUF4220 domain-containing protein n=1 Tax=Digitaria exilis TaxID=1010633 RepID=A0A835E8X9_9POAL|nr:hypothetical protein HU200_048757 [Digitaria exilis]
MSNDNCTSNVSQSIIGVLDVIAPQIAKANGLLFWGVILVGVVVGIGTYAPRYRRHPLIGILFVAATTHFLPIISSVAASVTSTELLIHTILINDGLNSRVYCTQYAHIFLIFVWAGLVMMVAVNASVIVVGDARERRNIGPLKAVTGAVVWTTYLTISTLVDLYREKVATIQFIEQRTVANVTVLGQLFLIMYTKLIFKYYAFYKAKHSFAHGRSPSLVDGYMDQLQQLGDNSDTPTILKQGEYTEYDARLHPPALIVMGEDNAQVDNQPYGNRLKWIPGQGDKVLTLDRVWKLDDMDMLQSPSAQPKYLVFSFTLFKLLRCRFAKYTISSASFTKTQKFFRYTLIKGSGAAGERAFRIVVDELSFLHDYYNSSKPIYYSHHGFVIFNIILSLYTIGYCIYLMVIYIVLMAMGYHHSQIYCSDECLGEIFEADFAGKYSDYVQRPPSPVPCDTHADLIDGSKCTSYTILTWHIATTVFEVQQNQQQHDKCPHNVAATHLSRYCAYLVACYPELLTDNNDEWCKRLYEDAKKEAARVLSTPRGATATYPLIVDLLSTQSTHSVLKDGASLGKQLVDSGMGWEPLARFWSEMILYVAPSENLEAQAEAVARGGELITLIWAMLSHAGIDRK